MASEQTEAVRETTQSSPATQTISRRRFLGGAAAATAGAAFGIPALLSSAALAGPAHSAAFAGSAAHSTAGALAISPEVGTLLANIRFGDSAARAAAVKYAALIGTEALPALGRVYAGQDPAAGRAAYEGMKKIAYNAGRPGALSEARAAATHLLALTGPGYPRQVRANSLELLGVVGGPADVKAIAALIEDREVGEDARLALQRIPGREADAALRSAARSADSDRRAAIQLSLRQRRLKRSDLGVKR